MRWLIIIWLLLSASANFNGIYILTSHSHETLLIIENVRDVLSRQEYSGQKTKALDELNDAINELHSIFASPYVKLSYIIMIVIGLMAIVAAILLIARKEHGVKLGLITLTLMLAWGIPVSFSKESYRKQIASKYTTIYKSVSAISEKEVGFSQELQEAVKPKLATSLSVYGIDFLVLLLLFLKRKQLQKGKSSNNGIHAIGGPSATSA